MSGRNYVHPGRGSRRGRPRPKGRQVEPDAVDEIQALLGDHPRRRDLLIEHLHRIQDQHGHISARHLAALAEEMRIPMAEAYEVATFYAHFDVVKENETPPPELTVRVCDSLTCELYGSADLLAELESRSAGKFRVVRAPCMGRCFSAPTCEVGHRHVDHARADAVIEVARSHAHGPDVPAYRSLAHYLKAGGYQMLRECLSGARSRADVLAELETSDLRGLGGAGFPAHRKWRFVMAEPRARLFALNADEGEPGTFKDRFWLERDPHRVIEGMLIACWGIEAENAFVYLRDEYPHIHHILRTEIAALERAGLVPRGYIRLRRGAGAYICGEESAMLESIEGNRGLPRHRPPYPAQVGLFGRPTLIHNVETMFWVPEILARGGKWFASQGRRGAKGLRSFSVSGRVAHPGVKVAPAGVTVRELIHEFCGGMEAGHTFKAYLPGGASGGILPASLGDIPLDFGQLEKFGCFVGSHAVVILSDADNMAAAARNLMAFFADESCGQCTPCRVGTEKALDLMAQPGWDGALLTVLSDCMRDASICGLGQAAPNPMLSVLNHFADEVGGR